MIKTCAVCASEFYTQRGVNQVTCSYDCNAHRRRTVSEAQVVADHQRRRAPNPDPLPKAHQMGVSSR